MFVDVFFVPDTTTRRSCLNDHLPTLERSLFEADATPTASSFRCVVVSWYTISKRVMYLHLAPFYLNAFISPNEKIGKT
jgi:hypothetical protein